MLRSFPAHPCSSLSIWLRGAALSIGTISGTALAAEITVRTAPPPAPVNIFLDGKIILGDLNRLTLILEDLAKQRPAREVVLALNSPGGDHFIGLRVALLLRRNGVGTVVLPGHTCWSACSSILFGGYDLKARKPNRVVYETARIGVHRMSSRDPIPVNVERRVVNAAQDFLNDMEISFQVQRKLFETSPSDMYVLSAAELLESGITVRPDN